MSLLSLAKNFIFDQYLVKQFYQVALKIGQEYQILNEEETDQAKQIITVIDSCEKEGYKEANVEPAQNNSLEVVLGKIASLEHSLTSFTNEQMAPKVAKYLLQKGNQYEASWNLKMAKIYYQAALNESDSADEVHRQATQALANLRKLKEVAKGQKSEERIQQIEKVIEEMKNTIRTRNKEEMEEIEQHQIALEREKASLGERMKAVAAREQKNAEFEEKYQNWEKKLQAPEGKDTKGSKEVTELLVSVREANEEVDKDKRDYSESTARAEDAKLRLEKSEKDLREKRRD